MPPYLAIPHYHLSKLPVTTKIALTFFSASILTALLFVAFAVFAERTGYTTRGVEINFAGTDHLQARGEVVEQEVAGKTKRQVYDIVHPHSFTMPIIFFILCHLMEMSYAARWLKLSIYVGGGLSMIVVTYGPLVIASSPSTAWFMVPAAVVMLGTFIAMTVTPVVQMWTSGGASAAPRGPAA